MATYPSQDPLYTAMHKYRRQRIIRRATFLILMGGIVYYVMEHLVFVRSESVPAKILFKTAGIPQRGDYVTFPVRHPYIGNNTEWLTKLVGCGSGDPLHVVGKDYYCNGNLIGHAKNKTLQGKPLTPFLWNGPIPPQQLFMVGKHPDSFDSKYLGFISTHQAQRLIPLL